jgi:hypothetical protein
MARHAPELVTGMDRNTQRGSLQELQALVAQLLKDFEFANLRGDC